MQADKDAPGTAVIPAKAGRITRDSMATNIVLFFDVAILARADEVID